MNGLDGLFSRQNRTMRTNLGQNEDNKMQKFDHNYAILTSASSRNAESDHKSCEKSQLLRHPRFPRCADGYARRPLTTAVMQIEDKNKNEVLRC